MKRILVIDESPAVRETLALILGREFTVIQRPPDKGGFGFSDNTEGAELLIVGITPVTAGSSSGLLRLAAQAPFAILFLVDSRSALFEFQSGDNISCLAKPFNPFELKDKVGELLARRSTLSKPGRAELPVQPEVRRFLGFPYVTRVAALLIQRFAATRLPILISGELGCGQDRIARGIHSLDSHGGTWLSVNADQVNADSLAKLRREGSSSPLDLGVTFMVENLERLPSSEYSVLANFVEEEQSKGANWRLIATSRTEILERVYRGEFPDSLYYKFATLTLSLPPLRDRQEDVPSLANWFAQFYAKRLGMGDVRFSPAAIERLRNYLWFGNLSEMETVIARTLAAQKKDRIEERDLVFEFSTEPQISELSEFVPQAALAKEDLPAAAAAAPAVQGSPGASGLRNGDGRSAELRVLIHELAHELKNPMVTIKTFAQLLGERYQDETFRARFQDVVDGDIERMDDLLEVMIEFADFSAPRPSRLLLEERLRSALEEIRGELSRKQASIRWKGNGNRREILSDPGHLKYVFKNVLLAVVAQTKVGGEIEFDLEKQGAVAISHFREGARIMPITHYLTAALGDAPIEVLPLRLLLAKQLLERNGGKMTIDHSSDEQDILKMEFPLA
ncbi:MAG: histidine kinase dimerization/phospho-acceptor domain-containing protein [Gammaproteobacteria bacterium]